MGIFQQNMGEMVGIFLQHRGGERGEMSGKIRGPGDLGSRGLTDLVYPGGVDPLVRRQLRLPDQLGELRVVWGEDKLNLKHFNKYTRKIFFQLIPFLYSRIH